MSGATPLLPTMPSGRTKGQLYLALEIIATIGPVRTEGLFRYRRVSFSTGTHIFRNKFSVCFSAYFRTDRYVQLL
jgi:hypothetical protein